MGRIGFRSNIYVSIRVSVRVISLNSPYIDYLEKIKIYSIHAFLFLTKGVYVCHICARYQGQ